MLIELRISNCTHKCFDKNTHIYALYLCLGLAAESIFRLCRGKL